MQIKHFWKAALFLVAFAGLAQNASAQHIGLIPGGGNEATNVAYFVSENPGYSWESVDVATMNAMTVAELNTTFDILIVPWTVSASLNMDWATRLLPYLNDGGNVLWEDPANAQDGDLAASGLTFGGSYTSSDITLVPPYDADGAEGYYHVHYTIASHNADWTPFSVDADGGVHGVVGEFGAGRMVLGVSDNLYHATFSSDPATYAFMINETNFVLTGSVSGTAADSLPIPTLSQWALITLTMLMGLVGITMLSRRRVRS